MQQPACVVNEHNLLHWDYVVDGVMLDHFFSVARMMCLDADSHSVLC